MGRSPPALRRVIAGLATLAVVCGFLVVTPVRAVPGNLDDERERNSTVDNMFGQVRCRSVFAAGDRGVAVGGSGAIISVVRLCQTHV